MNKPAYLLPIWDTIITAWDKVHGAKKTLWAAQGVMLLIFIVFGIFITITSIFPPINKTIELISQLINFLLQIGIMYIGIRRANDQPIEFEHMFRSFELNILIRIIGVLAIQFLLFIPLGVLNMFALSWYDDNSLLLKIVSISVQVIAPCLILFIMIRLMLSVPLVLDKGINSWQATRLSFMATRSNFWRLIALIISTMLIVVVSAVPLGIGLIWTMPFVIICMGAIYTRLLANTNQIPE